MEFVIAFSQEPKVSNLAGDDWLAAAASDLDQNASSQFDSSNGFFVSHQTEL